MPWTPSTTSSSTTTSWISTAAPTGHRRRSRPTQTTGLEQLRDFFDRHDLGLILIGMTGLDRQLARYSRLYSRIGFVHQYRPLDIEELPGMHSHDWH